MKNVLYKRIPRDIKKHIGKYLGIFLILVVTILLGSSFMATLESAESAIENNDKECIIEDGHFEITAPLSQDLIEEFKTEGTNVVPNFYYSENHFDETATLLVFDERTALNLPSVFDGRLPIADNEIAIERLFAQNRNIKVGDTIVINGSDFEVTGTVAVPDYSSLFKNNQDLLMNVNDFGISITTKEGFDSFDSSLITYRYSYKFDDTTLSDKEEAELAAKMQLKLTNNGYTIQSFLTAMENQSITFLREDMGKDGPVMKVFVYILIIIIAFIFAILTSNTIDAEAPIIGTLRSLGYKKSEIVMHYLAPTIIIALLSSIVGNGLGYTVMLKPFENLYYGTYSIAPIEIQFNLEAFITTTILPVVIMIFINWIMLFNKLSFSPLKFLRKDLKRKPKKARKLPRFSFITRFRIRVLLQNKVNYLILFFGIFLSSFLLMFGIGLQPLIDNYVEEIDDSLTYEYQYILKAPVECDNGEKLMTYSLKTPYELGNTDISVSFMGISDNSEFFGKIALPEKENEIIISKPLAEKMNLSKGDILDFKDEHNDKSYKLTVSEICDYKGSLTAFMSLNNLNSMLKLDNGTYNSYLSNEKLDIDEKYISKLITRSDMVNVAGQMMRSFEGIMKIVCIFSVVIYMVLMYILTKIVIEKNALSISFMKVFGYENKEINKLYLNASTITVIISLFVCIPLEALCFKFILVYISSMIEGYLPFYLPWWVYVAIIATGIFSYFIINAFHISKVRRIPMSEALKNRE